jgi:hypothetical protein
MLCVETLSSLPKCQSNGRDLRDKQLVLASPLESATQAEAAKPITPLRMRPGLDASRYTRVSPRGGEKGFS